MSKTWHGEARRRGTVPQSRKRYRDEYRTGDVWSGERECYLAVERAEVERNVRRQREVRR